MLLLFHSCRSSNVTAITFTQARKCYCYYIQLGQQMLLLLHSPRPANVTAITFTQASKCYCFYIHVGQQMLLLLHSCNPASVTASPLLHSLRPANFTAVTFIQSSKCYQVLFSLIQASKYYCYYIHIDKCTVTATTRFTFVEKQSFGSNHLQSSRPASKVTARL